ncbi:hypothetical protein J3F84DRAFT_234998 [Trichoderma pleuroticola]
MDNKGRGGYGLMGSFCNRTLARTRKGSFRLVSFSLFFLPLYPSLQPELGRFGCCRSRANTVRARLNVHAPPHDNPRRDAVGVIKRSRQSQNTDTRAPNRRDCRRGSPAHRHDATAAAAGGSTCPRAEMDGLIALSCMTEAAENGKEGHPRQGAWPCRSPWPGSAPLLGPLPEHSMRSPVVVSRIGQGLRGGGESAVCAKFEEAEPFQDLASCGFMLPTSSTYEYTSGRDSEESGVAANHHTWFQLSNLVASRRETRMLAGGQARRRVCLTRS